MKNRRELRHQLRAPHVPPFLATFCLGAGAGCPCRQAGGDGDHCKVFRGDPFRWIVPIVLLPRFVFDHGGFADGRPPCAPPALVVVVERPRAQPVRVAELREVVEVFVFTREYAKGARQPDPSESDCLTGEMSVEQSRQGRAKEENKLTVCFGSRKGSKLQAGKVAHDCHQVVHGGPL
jgi:hypothetical protein